MKYVDLIWLLDLLHRYYPRYYSSELLTLAEDILQWFNDELPEGSSSLVYLQNLYASPSEALQAIWNEVLLMAGPYRFN